MHKEGKSRKQLQREAAREPSEEEDDEEDANEYQIDGFVVRDEDASEEGASNSPPSHGPTPKKRVKKKKRKAELSEEEEQDIRSVLKSNKKRLRKIMKRRQDSVSSEDPEDLDSFEHSRVNISRLRQRQSIVNNLFPEEQDIDMKEVEEQAHDIEQPLLNKIFSEQNLRANYETPQDRLIVATDRPERLQLRFAARPQPTNEDLDREISWVTERMILLNREWAKETDSVYKKVKHVLESLILGNFEIMYQWLYLRNYFSDPLDHYKIELTLEDLWKIYDLDAEWSELYQKRKQVEKFLLGLKNQMAIPNHVINLFNKSYNAQSLNAIDKWIEYQFGKMASGGFEMAGEGEQRMIQKTVNPADRNGRVYRRPACRNFSKEMEQAGVKQLMDRFCISCQELAENLESKSRKYVPKEVPETINVAFGRFVRQDVPEFYDIVKALQSISKFIAMEYINYPPIRLQLRQIFERRVALSTTPTETGSTINVYSEYFAAKRIVNVKPAEIKPELWNLVRDAEAKNLVTVQFNIKKEDIQKDLSTYFFGAGKSQEEWNYVRQNIVQDIIKLYTREFCDGLRADLNEFGESKILSHCAKAFKQLIFVQPYKSNKAARVAPPPAAAASPSPDSPEKNIHGAHQFSDLRVIAATESDNICYVLLVNTEGDPVKCLKLLHLVKSSKLDEQARTALYEADREKLREFIAKADPSVVVILPKSLRCQYLKLEISSLIEQINPGDKSKPFVMWGCSIVPTVYATSPFAQQEHPQLDRLFLEALSMARYLQNPLCEVLNLWADNDRDNYVLKLRFHDRQHLISEKKLRGIYENIACEVVNSVGIDINLAIVNTRTANVLAFICGLGPRKAKRLIQNLKKVGEVHSRKELSEFGLETNVFVNAAGFLKTFTDVDPRSPDAERLKIEWLDVTRIHPDNYPLAVKLARDVMNDSKSDPNRIIMTSLGDPRWTQNLPLAEYADFLTNSRRLFNMTVILQFIVKELFQPFQDPRSELCTKQNPEEVFYALTREVPHNFCEESLVTVRVVSVEENGLKVLTSNNIQGFVFRQSCNVEPTQDMGQLFQAGQVLNARIKNISFETVRLKLSITKEDLANHKSFLYRNEILSRYGLQEEINFKLVKNEDFPLFSSQLKRKSNFVPRKITHPHFKNVGLEGAFELLKRKPIGEFLFRPCAKGNGFINLTWHIFNDIFAHLVITEGSKSPEEELSQTLYLDKMQFDSFDDIISRYIKPINQHVQKIKDSDKFCKESYDYVKQTLTEIYESNSELIPYLFFFSPKMPQSLILAYVIQKGKIQCEPIKIKPFGLIFHELVFPNLQILTKFYKEKFKTDEYQKFLEILRPSNLMKDSESAEDPRSIKEEHKNRRKDRVKEESRSKVKEEFTQKKSLRNVEGSKGKADDVLIKREFPPSNPNSKRTKHCDIIKIEHI